jgi:MFS family permease
VVLGIVGAFSSVGTLAIAPVLQALLGVWDWRWGAVLFVILAAAMVPAAMITGRVDRLPQPSLQRVSAAARAASPERRSVILGIVGAFPSVGTLVIAPALQGLLGAWDWRWGAVLFVVLAAAMIPAAVITGRVDRLPQPSLQRASAGAAIGEALRNRRFVVLCCTHFV